MRVKGSRTAPRARRGGADRAGTHDPARTAVFACRHLQEFRPPPSVGDLAYCQKCRDYRTVILLQSDYRARCRTCNFSQKFGRAAFAADGAARRHGDKTGHTVDRYDGSELQWTYSPGSEFGEQLALDDVPPF